MPVPVTKRNLPNANKGQNFVSGSYQPHLWSDWLLVNRSKGFPWRIDKQSIVKHNWEQFHDKTSGIFVQMCLIALVLTWSAWEPSRFLRFVEVCEIPVPPKPSTSQPTSLTSQLKRDVKKSITFLKLLVVFKSWSPLKDPMNPTRSILEAYLNYTWSIVKAYLKHSWRIL